MKISSPVIIIVSELDDAGKNMREHIRQSLMTESQQKVEPLAGWPEGNYLLERFEGGISIFSIPSSQIRCDYLRGHLETNLVIFASKHSSVSGQKTLLAHPTGNWGEDTIGSGRSHSISYAPAYALFRAYHSLKKYKEKGGLDEYWVGLEVTHHGPTELHVPLIFMECGGTEVEWNDTRATEVVASAIIDVAKEYVSMEFSEDLPAYIGVGGGHYAPSFIKRVDAEKLMVGHMVPKYHTDKLDEEFVRAALEKTIAKEKGFLIDKKGVRGPERRRLIEIFNRLNIPYALTTDFPSK